MVWVYRMGWCWVLWAVVGLGWACSVWLQFSTSTVHHTPQPASVVLQRPAPSHRTHSGPDTDRTCVTRNPDEGFILHNTRVPSPKRKKGVLERTWGSVMEERLARVARVCRKHFRSLKRFSFFDKITFDTKHHLAYCRNAKTGTTTWLGHLLEWAGVEISNMTSHQIHETATHAFPPLLPKAAAQELHHLPITFTVVRHPFTRLVSAYRDKMPEKYKRDMQIKMISKYRIQQRNTSSVRSEVISGINKRFDEVEGFEKNLKDVNDNIPSFKDFDMLSVKDSTLILNQTLTGALPALNESPETAQDMGIPTFREFVLFASDQVLKCARDVNFTCFNEVDVHWRPFYDRCAPCDVPYNIIAKSRLGTAVLDDGSVYPRQPRSLHESALKKL
nr:carbohydrate sulfotransferase 8-like isoform X2 [Procambarus clarkii]